MRRKEVSIPPFGDIPSSSMGEAQLAVPNTDGVKNRRTGASNHRHIGAKATPPPPPHGSIRSRCCGRRASRKPVTLREGQVAGNGGEPERIERSIASSHAPIRAFQRR
jgi:hypothetical protein